MQPMIDELALPQIQVIRTYDRRMLAEHRATQMDGSYFQNMGRKPTCVMLAGIASGSDALNFTEQLDDKFNQGEPVSFIADIIADADIETLLIDDLQLEELAGRPNRFAYVITLKEYIEPVAPANSSIVDSAIQDDALDLLSDLVDGLDLGLALPSGLESFIEPLGNLLSRLREFSKRINQNG